jgi:hypothetical protein
MNDVTAETNGTAMLKELLRRNHELYTLLQEIRPIVYNATVEEGGTYEGRFNLTDRLDGVLDTLEVA